MTVKKNVVSDVSKEIKLEDLKIGYVMPIAKTEGYPETHWNDVMRIIDDTIIDIGIRKGRIVSDGGAITTIHSRIVSNLNEDHLIICDVSSRNPNVMFELGMRIAFDKPVIIIKDDATEYCFDSGTIEHISYPKDLRHGLVNKFQDKLEAKIKATYEEYIKSNDKKNSPILKNFGSFDKGDIKLDEISANEALIQDIRVIKDTLVRLQMTSSPSKSEYTGPSDEHYLLRSKSGITRINIKNIMRTKRGMVLEWLDNKSLQYKVNRVNGYIDVVDEGGTLHDELLALINQLQM